MAYSPIDAFEAKVQIDYERVRDRKAAQKAANHKASLSRAAAATGISSSPQGLAGSPPTLSKSPASSTRSRMSNSSPSPSVNRRSSTRATSRPFDMINIDYADVVDGDQPGLDHSSGGDSASETDHEASFESRMSTLHHSLIAPPIRARGSAAVADHYVSHGSPSPPKHDISLSASNEQAPVARPFVERVHDGPGLGLRGDGHWYETEEEDGHACWTAYANNGPTSSVIVVRECRW